MTKVTFKKYKKVTGLRAIGYSKQSIDLKIKNKVFGTIHAPNWASATNEYKISIMVVKDGSEDDGNDNCKWRRITFKARFADPEDAKNWIQQNIDDFMSKYTLHFEED